MSFYPDAKLLKSAEMLRRTLRRRPDRERIEALVDGLAQAVELSQGPVIERSQRWEAIARGRQAALREGVELLGERQDTATRRIE